ncbi:ATP-binding cassette domain-containing protein [Streptomyces sp. LP05-1]|uniref:ATP-binding cassette domain-containing protein n=1 Tax=Streptomyces pyxinae TaxID=2970734 RepID=A0ABT2CJM8_9ACTN|nr:ATP-binding cassette domain-containing protein [Streptomyces sp. LP05-1]MCS0637617.1 ATP-binding cassette domain-containing protein [Streptomyces sp. LP05-1]
MLQAIGLTSTPLRDRPPAVRDLSFEARPGSVTALLGARGAGKTTALRLMLELEPGRGVTHFRGRPLHHIAHPAREVGVLLGAVPGHPARTARGQLRMLCAAAGMPAARADELLDIVGLGGLGDHRLGALSLGMDRRLGIAVALLGDPHTLLLDQPAAGLSPREAGWLHRLLRVHADHGGTVLYATDDPKEAARTADRVVTVAGGRLVADQDGGAFARTRLRPRVAVRTPHAARLAELLVREGRAARRSVEAVTEQGNRLSVYGSDCARVGETAHRHGIPLHRLAEETGDTGPGADRKPVPGQGRAPEPAGSPPGRGPGPGPDTGTAPVSPARPVRGPLRPVRYELRRLTGVPAAALTGAAVLVASALVAVLLARTGRTPLPTALAAWPGLFPLPPAAFGAGLLGALSFGDEYRYPALAAGRGAVPRRLGLLLAKLAVTAATALLLALLVAGADFGVLRLVYGGELVSVPANWERLAGSWAALVVGCGWAGLLGAGVFRAAAAGVAAVLAVPVLITPLVGRVLAGPSVGSLARLPARLRELSWTQWPGQADRWLLGAARVVAQPVGAALVLSLSALLCAYLFTGFRQRARW